MNCPRVLYLLGRRADRIAAPLVAAGVDVPSSLLAAGRRRFEVRETLAQLRHMPDVVVTDSIENAIVGAALARAIRRPLVVRIGGDAWVEAEGMRAQHHPAGRALTFVVHRFSEAVRSAALVVSVSRYLAHRVVEETSIPAQRVRTIWNTLDPRVYDAESQSEARARLGWDDDPVVVTATNFRFQKKVQGLVDLLPAVARSLAAHETLRWVVVGRGPMLEPFALRARDVLGAAADRFEVAGYVTNMPRYLRAASIYVHASGLDGLPRVVLEAQASGTPVVASRVGGVPEIVEHGRTGFLYSTAAEFLESFDRLLAGATVARAVSAAARQYAVRHHAYPTGGRAWWAALMDAIALGPPDAASRRTAH